MVSGELFLLATVGTDHHRFDRLIQWLDDWLRGHEDAKALVQYGASAPPSAASGVSMLPRDELLALMRGADVVVTQGGPGSIMDARACGRIPVVVPRVAAMNEVVDDHQVDFCRKLGELGWIHLAERETVLLRHLEAARRDPSAYRMPPLTRSVDDTARRVNDVLADVLGRPAGTVRLRRLSHLRGARR